MPLRCEILTQERSLFNQEVDLIIVPGTAGVMTILPNHSPLVSQLAFGELVIRTGTHEDYFAVGGGVIQVYANHVLVLADSAEQADEIDLRRAEEARERAIKLKEEGIPEDTADYAALEASIKRAQLRLKVGQRRNRGGLGASRTAQFSDNN